MGSWVIRSWDPVSCWTCTSLSRARIPAFAQGALGGVARAAGVGEVSGKRNASFCSALFVQGGLLPAANREQFAA